MEHGLVPEEWGGDTICVEVSAKEETEYKKNCLKWYCLLLK